MRLFPRNPIVRRREASLALEETAESGLVGKTETVGDGLYTRLGFIGKCLLQSYDKVMPYPIAGGISRLLFHNAAEMLG